MDFFKNQDYQNVQPTLFLRSSGPPGTSQPQCCEEAQPWGPSPETESGSQTCKSWFSGNQQVSRLLLLPFLMLLSVHSGMFLCFYSSALDLQSMLVSGIQCRDSFFRLYSIICNYEIMAIIPRAYSISLLLIYFLYIILYLLISYS